MSPTGSLISLHKTIHMISTEWSTIHVVLSQYSKGIIRIGVYMEEDMGKVCEWEGGLVWRRMGVRWVSGRGLVWRSRMSNVEYVVWGDIWVV